MTREESLLKSLEALQEMGLREDSITAVKHIPAQEGRYADYPPGVHPGLLAAFKQKGYQKLYSHQRTSWEILQGGGHIVVVTPTASGKTLCYNLPVLNSILNDPASRALYLFPTKALSQDQVAELYELIQLLGADIKTYTFDGDTPVSARQAIRAAGQIVVTNPDMLHTGVLPHHTKWINLFESLKYIVIDE